MQVRAPGSRVDRRVAASGLLLLGLLPAGLVAGPLALLVHGGWAPLQSIDEAVSDGAERLVSASPALLTAARAVTLLGDPLGVTVVAAVLVLALLAKGRRRAALYVVAARVGAVLLSTGLKELVGRARPVFDAPVATASGLSFPSGHALGGTAFWLSTAVVAIALVGRRRVLLAGATVLSVLVAASRVLLGVHHLSDVLAGLVLGLGWVVLCTALLPPGRSDERSAPVAYDPAPGRRS